MSLFNPDAGALSNASSVAFLAQRDVSLAIPVNFCTYPGVSLTAACFANSTYEESAGTRCISNLLAIGFRRIDVDVYWDASRQSWSLCPVELGAPGIVLATTRSQAASNVPTTTSLAKTSLFARDASATESLASLVLKQADVPSTTSVSTSLSTTSSPSPSSSAPTVFSNGTVVSIGPYTCSPSLDLDLLVDIISDYLSTTETNLNATTLIISGNIHAASSIGDPAGSAQKPPADRLPSPNALLSTSVASNTSSYLYTPANLADERSDLNGTNDWFSVAQQYQPDPAFFEIVQDGDHFSTPDGWPSEGYLAFTKGKRLLVEFGNVDPQMVDYNFSGDASMIFPQGYLTSPRNVTVSSAGGGSSSSTITQGCIYNPSASTLSEANSSWALTSLGSSGDPIPASAVQQVLAEASNLTSCGISPFLNATLANVTVDQSFAPYLRFVQQTLWSWAPGQPVSSNSNVSTTTYDCAALNATSGRWQALDCFETHLGACRNGSAPFAWSISTAVGTYQDVSDHCPENTSFDVPRTALENTYLAAAWRKFLAEAVRDSSGSSSSSSSGNNEDNDDDDHDDDDDDDDSDGRNVNDLLLWLNFNDLDINGCWVVGQNSTCPYPGPSTSATRRVVVPVVAGVIVFVLAGLTILVKCAGNHQSSKRRRRRGNDGYEYEGVPS